MLLPDDAKKFVTVGAVTFMWTFVLRRFSCFEKSMTRELSMNCVRT